MTLPIWRRSSTSPAHWLLVQGRKVLAEVEGVMGNPEKPTAYRIGEAPSEIALSLQTAMIRCEIACGLRGEPTAHGRRITGFQPYDQSEASKRG